MPAQITYWTGIWEPEREALSKQVQTLRANLAPSSPVVSFSAGQRTHLMPRNRVLRLSSRRWWSLRVVARLLEPRGDVSHLIDGLDSWHLLRALGRRPLVFTVAIPGVKPLKASLYDKVRVFVADTDRLRQDLRRIGIERERVRTVYPGIDLRVRRPTQPPADRPFRLLFASTPASPDEFEPRGIPLLVELARAIPEIEVRVLWRLWGDLRGARRKLASLAPPQNFQVREGDVSDMAAEYADSHATVCLFATNSGKSCPASVVEGLAHGRPSLVAEGVGISALVDEHRAGCVAERQLDAVASGVERLRSDHAGYCRRARLLAERHFDQEKCMAEYAAIYRSLTNKC